MCRMRLEERWSALLEHDHAAVSSSSIGGDGGGGGGGGGGGSECRVHSAAPAPPRVAQTVRLRVAGGASCRTSPFFPTRSFFN